MIFDMESPECFREVIRLARKQHRCCECRILIMPRERYQYISGIWSGEPANFKTCLRCAALRNDVHQLCKKQDRYYEGIQFEGLYEEIENSRNPSPEWEVLRVRWNEIKLLKLKQQFDLEHGLQQAIQ